MSIQCHNMLQALPSHYSTSPKSHKEIMKPSMEAMMDGCGWLAHYPAFGSLDRDPAIRQFGPARMEQEQKGERGRMLIDDEVEMWSHFASEITQLTPSEVEQIVDTFDSFFNVECYEKDNADKFMEEENEVFGQFQEDGLGNLSMIDDIYCQSNDAMMIEGDDDHGYQNDVGDVITNGFDQGLQLVHLLLACAEAVGCRDAQLTESILARIWLGVSPWGDSLRRVLHAFSLGLKTRLSFLQNVSPNGAFSCRASLDLPLISREEKSEAFALLHQTTPYIAFGFVAANDAICEEAKGKDSLHIIDLGMEHNFQWPDFVRALSSRPEGPPKLVRITGIVGGQDPSDLEASIIELKEEAISLGISLDFHLLIEEVSPLSLTREKLKLRGREALVINSIMHLHKHVRESRGSLKAILQSIKRLNPAVLTVVEQDANHNGPFFLGRFLESLHYCSAIFDSLDASLPRDSPQRMKIECVHLTEEIRNVLAYEGSERTETHERADLWRRQLSRAGFQARGLSCLNRAKMLVNGYGCDGYTVAGDKGCLQLGWKGRPIMLASAWQVQSLPSS